MNYQLQHYYQPTNNTCSQASLAMVLSHYGKTITPQKLATIVPVKKSDSGEEWGTLNQHLATWCLSQGFAVTMHSADFQILDTSWAGLPRTQLLERMQAARGHRDVLSLGRDFSQLYLDAYIEFVQAGGELHVERYWTPSLLDKLLAKGPLIICVCMNLLYSTGRTQDLGSTALRQSPPDDINGSLYNHTVVLHGKTSDGNYRIADPWKEPGFYTVAADELLGAMYAAQMECDNFVFALESPRPPVGE